MAKGKDKPKNGHSDTRRPSAQSTPKGSTRKKDPGGFVSPGFKSEGFTGRAKEKKPRSGQSPPSVREKERKGGPPSQRPSSPGKKKTPKRPKLPKWPIPKPDWGTQPWPEGPRKPKKPWPKPKPKKPMKPGKKKARKK